MEAIEDMGLVYSQNVMMICAADDRCSTDGLRGVYTTPRKEEQITARIATDFALAAQFDSSEYIQNSVYNSRGWTYVHRDLPSLRC
jgi:hypothetical protein